MKVSVRVLELALATLVLAAGLAIAFSTLSRGVWLDEFITRATTAPDVTGRQFLVAMSTEQHPLLHYGLIFLAQAAGLTTFAELRGLNILGVVLVLAALWHAYRRHVVDSSAVCIIVSLYASSPIFLDYFAELRAYCLLYSASIAVTLAWLTLRETAATKRTSSGDLVVYGVSLAIFTSLHYFATLLGGLLTLALALEHGLAGRVKTAMAISVGGIIAAAPALVMGAIQREATFAPGRNTWVTTSPMAAVSTIGHVIRDATASNLPALACGIVTMLFLVERKSLWKDLRGAVMLGATVALFFAVILGLNTLRPIVVDRYLFAAAGAVGVGVALLSARPGMPQLATSAICLFALTMEVDAVRTRRFHRDGWRTSAQEVAHQVASCPGTRVFADPFVYQGVADSEARFWREGYRFYADAFAFDFAEIGRGATVSAAGVCPSLVWIEHSWRVQGFPLDRLLAELNIKVIGGAALSYVGSGAVIVVR
jgi:hypothetical protein